MVESRINADQQDVSYVRMGTSARRGLSIKCSDAAEKSINQIWRGSSLYASAQDSVSDPIEAKTAVYKMETVEKKCACKSHDVATNRN
jgi:hypothetical protein